MSDPLVTFFIVIAVIGSVAFIAGCVVMAYLEWVGPWISGLVIGRQPHNRECDERDKRDWQLFKLPNEKGKFAIQIGYPDEVIQRALERAMDNDWVQLIDIEVIAHGRGTLCRVFKLTQAGHARHATLKAQYAAAE